MPKGLTVSSIAQRTLEKFYVSKGHDFKELLMTKLKIRKMH